MAEYVVKVGSRSAQGLRPNNEDSFIADPQNRLFLVADGMGGQESGEKASGLAAEIIPRVLHDRLAANDDAARAMQSALEEANQAIIDASRDQAAGRRMGTTAVVALQCQDKVYVAGLGDSRAYLIRGDRVEQLTVDHTVAEALVRNGAMTPEEAAQSRWGNVLYKFLGCVEMTEGAEVQPFEPQAGDRLLLGTDGLTNHVSHAELRESVARYPHPQDLADYLVDLALAHGSRDNVTCVVVAFDKESEERAA